MKTNIFKYLTQAALSISLLSSVGCTDLSVEVYSEISEEIFGSNPDAITLLTGDVYTNVASYASATNPNYTPFYYNVATTDEIFIPYRNVTAEWNNAKFYDTYQHTWTSTTSDLSNNWTKIFGIVTAANFTIDMINSFDDMDETLRETSVAELRMVRAFAYFLLIDLWGDVPVSFSSTDTDADILKHTSSEIYDMMMTEFDECLPILKEEKSDKSVTYGKFGYWASLAIKSKYLLNEAVYRETNRENPSPYSFDTTVLNELIDVCDELINDGGYSLESDYFTNFLASNEVSKENIYVIPFDETYSLNSSTSTLGFAYCRHALHSSESTAMGTTGAGQNGFSALPSMYKTFNDDDLRRNGLNVGPQYDSSGEPLMTVKANSNGAALDFTIDWDIQSCGESDGARFRKYEFVDGLTITSMDNDFVVIRLADIMLMKAEALMRLNGGTATQEAVSLVNSVWNRSNPSNTDYYTTSNLTLESLLEERRRELYGEAHRRTDLIRFEKYTDMEWAEEINMDPSVISTAKYRTVLPLPNTYLLTSPQIEQHSYYK